MTDSKYRQDNSISFKHCRMSGWRAFLWMLVTVICMAIAVPNEAEAAKKRSSKAKTTATAKKKTATRNTAKKTASTAKSTSSSKKRKTTSKSRKGSSSRRRAGSSSSKGGNWALTAADVNPDSKSPEVKAKKSSKRQVTVERPDLEAIRVATLDPKNPMYFPKLMKKFNRNDTTMTADEFRHLYLGYMFQEDYDPYRESPYSSVTDAYRNKTSHSKEEIDTIRKYAELTLLDNPFDLRQMSFLVHVLKERRKDMSAKIWEYRLEHLLGAIKSTGTGENEENAWFVIYPAHEYDMVQLMGYHAVDADFIEPGFDYLIVEPEEETARRLRDKVQKGFYFDVRQIHQQYELKHPEDGNEEDEASDAAIDEESAEDPDDIPAEEDPDDTPAEEDPDDIPAEENPDDIPAEENPDDIPAEENPDIIPAEEPEAVIPAG
ncbi:MAG: DUF4919 domain-containing protein [Muribaculaceae bacterium]|nr:DUF4919 domain-containing protein [Muribaculaceae bacterium]